MGGRHSFEALSGDLWGAQQWLVDLPVSSRSRADVLRALLNERRLNELVSNYAYAADSHDGSWASSLFTDDALLIDGPYVVEGRDAAAHLAAAGTEQARSFHRYSNTLVRLVPGRPDAFVLAYVHVAAADGDERSARFGRVFARATASEGRWRIAQWRTMTRDSRFIRVTTWAVRTAGTPRMPDKRQQESATDKMWAAFESLTETRRLTRHDKDAIRALFAESEVRAHLHSYAGAFDSKDLGRIVSHFTADAVLETPRGNYRGLEEISAFYQPQTAYHRTSMHRVENVVVRVDADGLSSVVAAYFHAPFVAPERGPRAVDARSQHGRYFGHLVCIEEGWRIAEWHITVDQNRTYPTIF